MHLSLTRRARAVLALVTVAGAAAACSEPGGPPVTESNPMADSAEQIMYGVRATLRAAPSGTQAEPATSEASGLPPQLDALLQKVRTATEAQSAAADTLFGESFADLAYGLWRDVNHDSLRYAQCATAGCETGDSCFFL